MMETTLPEQMPEGETEALKPHSAAEDERPADEVIAERLERLAKNAARQPSSVEDRRVSDYVDLPNGKGRFRWRRMGPTEVREHQALGTRTTGKAKLGQAERAAREQEFEVSMRTADAYLFLCGAALEEIEIVREDGSVRKADRQRGKGPLIELCKTLDPAVSQWLELYLEFQNGITDEQQRELGNT